jgi:hypothetical protein
MAARREYYVYTCMHTHIVLSHMFPGGARFGQSFCLPPPRSFPCLIKHVYLRRNRETRSHGCAHTKQECHRDILHVAYIALYICPQTIKLRLIKRVHAHAHMQNRSVTAIEGARTAHAGALEGVERFHTARKACLHELTLRQGLGKVCTWCICTPLQHCSTSHTYIYIYICVCVYSHDENCYESRVLEGVKWSHKVRKACLHELTLRQGLGKVCTFSSH